MCGSKHWANDIFCDDGNNNAGCNWDGGACCNNPFKKSTNFCKGNKNLAQVLIHILVSM